ncbi:MAG: hypothetical protein IJW62_07500, partial [Clostridia bacterium]|nr:hypothetical protein [Clostridia bacterium]
MKKAISILLTSIMLLGTLAACQSESNDQEGTTGATTGMNEPTTTNPSGVPATEIDGTAHEEIEYYQNPLLT